MLSVTFQKVEIGISERRMLGDGIFAYTQNYLILSEMDVHTWKLACSLEVGMRAYIFLSHFGVPGFHKRLCPGP